ncbi:MAG: ABC transporter ATP-binding protein, partial [Alistipes sp.]
ANLDCEDVVARGRAPYTNWIGRMQSLDRDMVAGALRTVGMEQFARRAIDTLSDGECQRIMIARALVQQTPNIILDEPTAFLDIPTRFEICNLLSRLAHKEGKCILFSTHDIDAALPVCDSVAVIAGGSLHKYTADEVREQHIIDDLFMR